MWHEARRMEKRTRSLMIDHRKRVERRKEYFDKLREDPIQMIRAVGHRCKIHVDPEISKMAQAPGVMMNWQGDDSNKIDRFDARSHLDFIPDMSRKAIPSLDPFGKERQEDSDLDHQTISCLNYERFRGVIQNTFLKVSEDEGLLAITKQTEQLKTRYSASLQKRMLKKSSINDKGSSKSSNNGIVKKNEIGFNYDDPSNTDMNINFEIPIERGEDGDEDDTDKNCDELCLDFSIINSINKTFQTQSKRELERTLNGLGKQFNVGDRHTSDLVCQDIEQTEMRKQDELALEIKANDIDADVMFASAGVEALSSGLLGNNSSSNSHRRRRGKKATSRNHPNRYLRLVNETKNLSRSMNSYSHLKPNSRSSPVYDNYGGGTGDDNSSSDSSDTESSVNGSRSASNEDDRNGRQRDRKSNSSKQEYITSFGGGDGDEGEAEINEWSMAKNQPCGTPPTFHVSRSSSRSPACNSVVYNTPKSSSKTLSNREASNMKVDSSSSSTSSESEVDASGKAKYRSKYRKRRASSSSESDVNSSVSGKLNTNKSTMKITRGDEKEHKIESSTPSKINKLETAENLILCNRFQPKTVSIRDKLKRLKQSVKEKHKSPPADIVKYPNVSTGNKTSELIVRKNNNNSVDAEDSDEVQVLFNSKVDSKKLPPLPPLPRVEVVDSESKNVKVDVKGSDSDDTLESDDGESHKFRLAVQQRRVLKMRSDESGGSCKVAISHENTLNRDVTKRKGEPSGRGGETASSNPNRMKDHIKRVMQAQIQKQLRLDKASEVLKRNRQEEDENRRDQALRAISHQIREQNIGGQRNDTISQNDSSEYSDYDDQRQRKSSRTTIRQHRTSSSSRSSDSSTSRRSGKHCRNRSSHHRRRHRSRRRSHSSSSN